jgi:hypothetical protein
VCPNPKIERWPRTLKNRILLEKYYLPGDLEAQMRYHESIGKLTPADVYLMGPDHSDRKGKDPMTDSCQLPLAA